MIRVQSTQLITAYSLHKSTDTAIDTDKRLEKTRPQVAFQCVYFAKRNQKWHQWIVDVINKEKL